MTKRHGGKVGVDFYGRPTEALWFHLPLFSRKCVAWCLNIGWVAHYASLITHCVYWPYWDTQHMPGAIAVNLPFIVSILFPIIGGVIQGNAEEKVIAAYPKRFPPTFGKYLKQAWADYKKELAEGRPTGPAQATGICCAGFIKHLRAAQEQMKKDQEEYEALGGQKADDNLAGIVVTHKDAPTATSTTTPQATTTRELAQVDVQVNKV